MGIPSGICIVCSSFTMNDGRYLSKFSSTEQLLSLLSPSTFSEAYPPAPFSPFTYALTSFIVALWSLVTTKPSSTPISTRLFARTRSFSRAFARS